MDLFSSLNLNQWVINTGWDGTGSVTGARIDALDERLAGLEAV
jgi:ATP-dependent phosphoenolpyruvate carboxykinase